MLAAGILVTGQSPSGEADLTPPIVFVSRNHIQTLNNYEVGPPVDILGREMTVGGASPDNLPIEFDVGNVTTYQPEYLQAGQKYYFQIRPYDAAQFGPPQAKQVSATLVAPRVDRITPASGPTWGGTEVTIEGDNFLPGLSVKIGGQFLRNVKVLSPQKITGTTYRNSAGWHDVLVRNPGKQEGILHNAFKHE